MTTIIDTLNTEQIAKLGAKTPDFAPGDTLRVNVKVIEGTRERVQAFEGVCIGRKNAGVNSSFTVRRAKLYYLRGRRGKAARISEKGGQGGEAEAAAAAQE